MELNVTKKQIGLGLAAVFMFGSLAFGATQTTAGRNVTNQISTTITSGAQLNTVLAESDTDTANDASRKELNTQISSAVNKNKYQVEGGGTITGAQLVQDGNIISVNYDKLTGTAKQQLVNDMVTVAETQAAQTKQKQQQDGQAPAEGAVTDETVSNWIKDIQDNPGVGARMLTETLKDVKPDYEKAHYIMEPFKGPVNTAIAFVVITVMLLLTLTFAIDLSYLYIPMINNAVGDGSGSGGNGKEGGFKASSLVSREAIQAYKDSEDGRSSAWAYLKKRAVGAMFLGLCILFLAQGQIWQIVGWILDLVSGVLNLK